MSEHSHSPAHSSTPLRSAMKHRDSTSLGTSRPGSPMTSPTQAPLLLNPALSPLIGTTSLSVSNLPLPTAASSSSSSPSPGLPASGGYTPKVSFDTFENPAASMFSFTLSVKSEGYVRSRSTRVFLCASSPDESGSQALDWALDALVQDSDELIVFRGVDTEDLERDHNVVREEARELLNSVATKSVEYDPDRKLSIIVEYIAGKVTDTIDRLIALYRPDSVVVGTRGPRNMIQSWGAAFGAPGMGSVSKYCLCHSPVPVIVVRPERKVKKAMEKRRADPKRGKHFDELTKTRSHPVGTIL